jgi:hypothetical protein
LGNPYLVIQDYSFRQVKVFVHNPQLVAAHLDHITAINIRADRQRPLLPAAI